MEYKWVTWVINLLIGVRTPFITGRGPTCLSVQLFIFLGIPLPGGWLRKKTFDPRSCEFQGCHPHSLTSSTWAQDHSLPVEYLLRCFRCFIGMFKGVPLEAFGHMFTKLDMFNFKVGDFFGFKKSIAFAEMISHDWKPWTYGTWVTAHSLMGYIGGITHLLTIDPNFLGRPSTLPLKLTAFSPLKIDVWNAIKLPFGEKAYFQGRKC